MLPISMVTLGSHELLKFLSVEALKVPRPTGVLTLKNRTRSPLAEVFIDGARKLATTWRPIEDEAVPISDDSLSS